MFRTQIIKHWPLLLLIFLFGVSVLVRMGSFSMDPIKEQGYSYFQHFNNTEVWIHDEFVATIYDTQPISKHLFASYVGGGEDFLPSKTMPGSTIYTSFPPTQFVVLFGALKILGGISFLNMQLFSLAIHLLCVLLLYYLALLLTRNKLVSVLGALVYIFSTGTLWFHMNVYWAHQLLMPVFL